MNPKRPNVNPEYITQDKGTQNRCRRHLLHSSQMLKSEPELATLTELAVAILLSSNIDARKENWSEVGEVEG